MGLFDKVREEKARRRELEKQLRKRLTRKPKQKN